MVVLLGLLLGCGGGKEGSAAGECGDNADNDRDGLVDCFDPDCTGSVECGGGDDTDATTDDPEGLDEATCLDGLDNDDDGDFDCDDDGCAGLFECDVCTDLSSDAGDLVVTAPAGFAVTFTRSYDFDELGDSFCGLSPGLCDCSATYVGDVAYTGGAGSTLSFEGTWALDSTDCQEFQAAPGRTDSLAKQVWFDAADPSAFMTLRFDRAGARLVQWVVHDFEGNSHPFSEDEGIRENGQFWMACMNAPYAGVIPYSEVATIPVDGGGGIIINVTVTDLATFTFR